MKDDSGKVTNDRNRPHVLSVPSNPWVRDGRDFRFKVVSDGPGLLSHIVVLKPSPVHFPRGEGVPTLRPLTCYTCFATFLVDAAAHGGMTPITVGTPGIRLDLVVTEKCPRCGSAVRDRLSELPQLRFPVGTSVEMLEQAVGVYQNTDSSGAARAALRFLREALATAKEPAVAAAAAAAAIGEAVSTGDISAIEREPLLSTFLAAIGWSNLSLETQISILALILGAITFVRTEMHAAESSRDAREIEDLERRQLEVLEQIRDAFPGTGESGGDVTVVDGPDLSYQPPQERGGGEPVPESGRDYDRDPNDSDEEPGRPKEVEGTRLHIGDDTTGTAGNPSGR